jgi:protein subunit release factor A
MEENPMSVIYIEIRAAEGGEDSKLLVREQAAIYLKAAVRGCL